MTKGGTNVADKWPVADLIRKAIQVPSGRKEMVLKEEVMWMPTKNEDRTHAPTIFQVGQNTRRKYWKEMHVLKGSSGRGGSQSYKMYQKRAKITVV